MVSAPGGDRGDRGNGQVGHREDQAGEPAQPSLRRMRRFEIKPDRDLGQNFLIDSNILGVIERAAELRPEAPPAQGTSPHGEGTGEDVVLEIGGGLGVLSEHLAARARHVHVVEIDERLRPALLDATEAHANVSLHWEDVMRMDLAALAPAPTKVVANLPYGVAAGALLRTIERAAPRRAVGRDGPKGGRRAARRDPRQLRLRRAFGDRPAGVRGPRDQSDPARRVPSRAQRRLRARRHAAHRTGAQSGRKGPCEQRLRAPTQDAGRLAAAVRARVLRSRWFIRKGGPTRARARGFDRARPPRGHARRAALAGGLPGTGGKAGNRVTPGSGPSPETLQALGLPLRACAPAKINLGLFLGPIRPDGRHELVSVMQSISLADELTLEQAPGASADEVVCPGVARREPCRPCPAPRFGPPPLGMSPPLRLEIEKRIPVAAGLGGGSADAAAALRLAQAASGLGDEGLLFVLAAELGADVPAQLTPGRWLATGAGEVLRALPDPVSPFGVLVLPRAAMLSTADVYAAADRLGLAREASVLEDRRDALARAFELGAALPNDERLLHNDLQAPPSTLCPEIKPSLGPSERRGRRDASS